MSAILSPGPNLMQFESEARFLEAFESSAIGMALLSLDGRILRVNEAVCQMSGYAADELSGRMESELAFPEDRLVGVALASGLLNGKPTSHSAEKRYLRKNGETFWVRLTLSLVLDGDGRPAYLVGMIEDIDQQKRTFTELQESEARFRAMFENSAVGMGLMSLDRRIIDANPAMCTMLGLSREELIGQTPAISTYAEDYPGSTAQFQQMISGQLEHFVTERRYVRKDGQVFWARTFMSVVRGPDGVPLYIVGLINDIDEQKRAVEDLRESEARFRAMYDNAAVGMALMSLDRKVLSINQTAARMTGYSMAELVNTDPGRLSHPEDALVGMAEFREMVVGKIPGFQVEKRFLTKSGGTLWGRVTYSIVPDEHGKPQLVVGIIEDVTGQRLANQKLAEQEAESRRTLEQHVEARTSELAEANLKLLDEIEQRKRVEEELAAKAAEEAVVAERTRLARDLHDAVTQTLFASSLIAEVLPDLWRIDAEEAARSTEELRQLTRGALAEMRTLLLELRPAALTQSKLGDLIRQLCEALIGRSRLPIDLVMKGERPLPPEVQIAFYRIAQEALNNVFKYARATKVNVGLFQTTAGVHLDICDNGIGFDMTTQKPTTLGLRIMRERAEAIGAELGVTSRPGAGTCIEAGWNDNPAAKLAVFKRDRKATQ